MFSFYDLKYLDDMVIFFSKLPHPFAHRGRQGGLKPIHNLSVLPSSTQGL